MVPTFQELTGLVEVLMLYYTNRVEQEVMVVKVMMAWVVLMFMVEEEEEGDGMLMAYWERMNITTNMAIIG